MTYKRNFVIMLFYDWRSVYKEAKGVSGSIVDIIEVMYRKKHGQIFARYKYDPFKIYSHKDFRGSSFLKYPELIVLNRKLFKDKDLATYIGLASFRNYMDYKLNKKLTLDLDFSPLSIEQINNNKLLRIEGKQIHFLFEDYTGE